MNRTEGGTSDEARAEMRNASVERESPRAESKETNREKRSDERTRGIAKWDKFSAEDEVSRRAILPSPDGDTVEPRLSEPTGNRSSFGSR